MGEAKDTSLYYLKPEPQQVIEGMLPLMEKHPRMKDVDLVIEGGVGTGVTFPDIAKRLFPDALYVGTDISADLMVGQPRVSKVIDETTLGIIQAANAGLSFDIRDAVIYANCFDKELVWDIAQKTRRINPILVTLNALYSLLRSDTITPEDMVSSNNPYMAQLHIGVNWEDKGATSLSSPYYSLESAAKSAGWTTERFDVGLLLIHP